MKQFIWEYLWELLIITFALISAILFAIAGYWYAIAWAILAGGVEGLYLRERLRLKRVKKEFGEYILKHPN